MQEPHFPYLLKFRHMNSCNLTTIIKNKGNENINFFFSAKNQKQTSALFKKNQCYKKKKEITADKIYAKICLIYSLN